MRINKFNYFREDAKFREELLDFCKSHLTYLLDKGISIEVNDDIDNSVEICISHANDWLNWDNISDDLVPFLKILNNNYEVIKVCSEGVIRTLKYEFEDVLNDGIKGPIASFVINIKK